LISNYVLMHFDNRRLVDNEFQLWLEQILNAKQSLN
jgi:hypothetical protein